MESPGLGRIFRKGAVLATARLGGVLALFSVRSESQLTKF